MMKVYKRHEYRILIDVKTVKSVANFYELHSQEMFGNFYPTIEIQWNLNLLCLSGVLKRNDGYRKTIDVGAYIK
jgi:hypothetical protein